jgi:hypothetical protein
MLDAALVRSRRTAIERFEFIPPIKDAKRSAMLAGVREQAARKVAQRIRDLRKLAADG